MIRVKEYGDEMTYLVECFGCNSKIEYSGKDVSYENGDHYFVCPICGRKIYVLGCTYLTPEVLEKIEQHRNNNKSNCYNIGVDTSANCDTTGTAGDFTGRIAEIHNKLD